MMAALATRVARSQSLDTVSSLRPPSRSMMDCFIWSAVSPRMTVHGAA
uniref:Uncharacterized protein n=1 Tax=Cutibacterium phage vB_CacS-HV1 TaxID=3236917 RepID=A0AB39CF16_9CAUD